MSSQVNVCAVESVARGRRQPANSYCLWRAGSAVRKSDTRTYGTSDGDLVLIAAARSVRHASVTSPMGPPGAQTMLTNTKCLISTWTAQRPSAVINRIDDQPAERLKLAHAEVWYGEVLARLITRLSHSASLPENVCQVIGGNSPSTRCVVLMWRKVWWRWAGSAKKPLRRFWHE